VESSTVQDKLTDVLRGVFDADDLVANRELTADQVDGWDSMAHVRLLITIEKKFGIGITAAESARLKTVGNLLDLIEAKLAIKK
jgi:acyl carrier protein